MTETEFKQILSANLVRFRKQAGLTQAEVAAHINYSDKSVSKWERGEGCPDVYVLALLAQLYGVTLGALAGEEPPPLPEEEAEAVPGEPVPTAADPVAVRAQSPFTVLLAVGGVWLVATIVFSCLNMLGFHASHAWLAFIYAIPASFLATELFAIRWKLPAILHLLFGSGILWTLMVSIHLSRPQVENIYLIYVIAAVAQLLGIFGLGLYWQMIHLPRDEWKQLFRRKKRRKTESAE